MPKLAIDIEARLAQFQDGLTRVEQAAGGIASRLDRAFGGLTSALGTIAALVAGGTLGAMVRNFADAGDQLSKLSAKTGIAVEALGELQYAAKLSDVSSEELGKGLSKLRLEMEQALTGSKDAIAAFEALGISQQQLARLSPDQVFARLADAFASGKAGAAELAKILGDRNWATFAPLLQGGSGALRAAGDEARKFGVVLSTEAARASEQFNDNLTRLGTVLQGVGNQLSAAVMPALSQVTQGMVDAARQGGALAAVLRGLGEAGKIALQFGPDATEVQKQKSYIQDLRGEIASIERSLKGDGVLNSGIIDRLINGTTGERRNKLAELRLSLQDAERALRNIQAAAEAKPAGAAPGLRAARAPQPEGGADPFAAGSERQGRLQAQIVLDQFEELARRRREIEDDLRQRFERGIEDDTRIALEFEQRLAGLLSSTPSGTTAAIQDDLLVLNDALVQGRINAQQYDEAFAGIESRFAALRGTGAQVKAAVDPAVEAFRDLENAIQGWGRAFNEDLVQALKRGQLDVKRIIDTILTDIARLVIYRAVTQPIFNALNTAAGSLFGGSGGGGNYYQSGGGRAMGGSVAGGHWYTVGERGPERLFVPPGGTGYVESTGSAGIQYNQTVIVNAPTDAATLHAAVRQGAALARSDLARAARAGALS